MSRPERQTPPKNKGVTIGYTLDTEERKAGVGTTDTWSETAGHIGCKGACTDTLAWVKPALTSETSLLVMYGLANVYAGYGR